MTAPSDPMTLAMRVTSWLPMKVFGVKWARKPLWRFSAQSSSKKLRSLMLDQMAFHSSYWVVASRPEDATNREWSPWITSPRNQAFGWRSRMAGITRAQKPVSTE